MKKYISLPVVCIGLLVLIFSVPPSMAADNKEEEQRFQLFNAEYNSTMIQQSKTTVFIEKRLFRIDTRTGDAWILVDVLKDGIAMQYWHKIPQKGD
ncbi:MAG: hypothetical protein Q8P24_18590 [Desulfobacterales bacterium]|nr:hypothetical protein [Desulfobacterales bacterium]